MDLHASSPSSSTPRRKTRIELKYMTPHKVLLLILIHAYCTASIPPQSHAQVFALLLEHVDPKEQSSLIQTFQDKLSSLPSYIPNTSVYNVLLEKIWELSSFDQFHTFMMSTSNYLYSRRPIATEIKTARPVYISSMLGRFVRKCRLEYIKLEFDEAGLLWNLFKASRAETHKDDDISTTEDLDESLELLIPEYSGGGSIDFYSQDNLEKLCRVEVEQFQKYSYQIADSSPELNDLISHSPSSSVSSLFVKFREAIRSGDYFSAAGYIHSYFDHTVSTQLSPPEATNYYQFALLNLATLHSEFGNYSDAAWAIREAINTARENKHDASLLFSLAWIHEFAKNPNVRNTTKVSVSKEESLQYLKTKTKEANIPSLFGTVNLMEASQLIRNGGSLVAVFADLLQASHINMIYHILQAVGRQMLFQAGLWTYLANDHLSYLYRETMLRHYSLESLTDDVVRANCIAAQHSLREGRASECFQILDSMSSIASKNHHVRQLIDLSRTAAELNLAINRKQLGEAILKLEKLKALEIHEAESSIHVFLGEVNVNLLRGDTEEALILVRQKLQKLKDGDDHVGERLHLMLVQSRLLIESENPSKALSILIRCVDLAEKHHIRLIYLGAVRLLAKVLNEFEQFQEAYRILSSVMPYIIETKDCYDEAFSYWTLAESLMGLPDDDIQQSNLRRAQNFLTTARNGFRSIEDVGKELSCLGKLAAVLDKLGDIRGRDDIAREFCELERKVHVSTVIE